MPNRAGSRGLARANCVRGRIDGCTCMFLWLRASGREKKKEIKTRWEGLRKLTQKKGRKSDKERNEWWSALEMHPRTCTGIYVLIRHTVAVHVRPPQQPWLEYTRASEHSDRVGGGMPQQCILFCLQFDPCSPLTGASRCVTSRRFTWYDAKCKLASNFVADEADNDSSGFQIPEKCNDLFYERNGCILMYGTAQHKKGSFSYSWVGNDFSLSA